MALSHRMPAFLLSLMCVCTVLGCGDAPPSKPKPAKKKRTKRTKPVAKLAASSPQQYAIKLHRPLKKGDKYGFVAEGQSKQSVVVKAGGQVVQNNVVDNLVRIDCESTVLAVNGDGEPIKLSLKINKCVKVEGETEKVLMPKGTVVVATRQAGKNSFTCNNKTVSADKLQLLDVVITLGNEGPTDDDVFGSEKNRAVGDSWPIAKAVAAQSLSEAGVKLRKEDVDGNVKLVGVSQVNGTPCLSILVSMGLKNLAFPLPPGLKVTTSKGTVVMSAKIPIDQAMPRLAETMEMSMHMVARGKPNPQGGEVEMEMHMKKSGKFQYRFEK